MDSLLFKLFKVFKTMKSKFEAKNYMHFNFYAGICEPIPALQFGPEVQEIFRILIAAG